MKSDETPTAVKAAPVDVSVLARHHEDALAVLTRIPYSLEYTTPQEILVILRLCYDYQVDFTLGLEPRGDPGETTRTFSLHILDGEQVTARMNVCRVRHESFLDYPQGVWLPDGDTLWAHHILGLLRHAIRLKLEACLARK